MTDYVINNDLNVKERISNEQNKVKDKADIVEGCVVDVCSIVVCLC